MKGSKNERAQQDQIYNNLSNPIFMQSKEGERVLPLFVFKRLVKSLKSYGYCDNMLHILTNEIVFEVRFGSLLTAIEQKIHLVLITLLTLL